MWAYIIFKKSIYLYIDQNLSNVKFVSDQSVAWFNFGFVQINPKVHFSTSDSILAV